MFGYLLREVVDERLIYVLHFGGVSTPCIDGCITELISGQTEKCFPMDFT